MQHGAAQVGTAVVAEKENGAPCAEVVAQGNFTIGFIAEVRIEWQRMAELLHQLDSIPEGNGTLLDNTMVLYSNDLAEGAAHSVAPNICWVAGGGGGGLKTGRFLQLTANDWTQLLVTAAHYMGVTSVNQVGPLGKMGPIPTLLG